MRFVLNEPKKADIKKIEAMKAVKGSFTQSGQFQVIIGNTVADFYNDFTAVAGMIHLMQGTITFFAMDQEDVLAYRRNWENQELLVCCNLSGRENRMEIESEWKDYQKLLGNYERDFEYSDFFILKPYEIVVLENGRKNI